MDNKITGLHHVTALTSDEQQHVDFYAGLPRAQAGDIDKSRD